MVSPFLPTNLIPVPRPENGCKTIIPQSDFILEWYKVSEIGMSGFVGNFVVSELQAGDNIRIFVQDEFISCIYCIQYFQNNNLLIVKSGSDGQFFLQLFDLKKKVFTVYLPPLFWILEECVELSTDQTKILATFKHGFKMEVLMSALNWLELNSKNRVSDLVYRKSFLL